MYISTYSAAVALTIFGTSCIASGVNAIPVSKLHLENAHGSGIANDAAQAHGAHHHKHEHKPKGRLGEVAHGVESPTMLRRSMVL